jgi:5,10-methylenetetrahydromethanopterin reductase
MRFGVGIYTGEPLPHIVEQVKLAESLGYDTVWLLDSQFAGREVYVTMATCARETSKILIGSGVTQTFTRHPSITACAFATLNELAPGRFLLGIGRGDSAVRSLGLKPVPFAQVRKDLAIIRGLLAGDEVEINGRLLRIKFVDPARPPHIPLYYAAGGPRATQLAPSFSDNVIMHCGAGVLSISRAVEWVREGAQKVGKDLANMDLVWWVHASIDEDWEKVKKHYGAKIVSRLRHQKAVGLEEVGVKLDPETFQKALDAYNFVDHATAGAPHAAYAYLFPDAAWKEFALVGNPRECYETVREGLKRNPDVTHMVINPPVSGFGITVEGIMETFARDIIGRLRAGAVIAP